ncbi:methyltransferase domain-containing protein [Agromyces sp. CFH 90414]|uniref:Methyltransferase domain-containing protein n=1 Tax=Agromyces agglutinans TaxID=2662258 RepID=A0A6I2F6M5_9MICO|nr:methyltransferase domain-containing protein [Agromyces agglutinans]MRG59407.1 methyltransferase domain-containing protein [Agromyces agglutinans]
MGEPTGVDDAIRHFIEDASDFAALDAEVWEPISLATVLRSSPQFGELVLDACCGTGASAVPAAELVGPGGLVDAVDLAEPMLDLARARAASLESARAAALEAERAAAREAAGEGDADAEVDDEPPSDSDASGGLVPQLVFHTGDAATWEKVGYDVVQCVLGVFFFDDVDAGVRHLASRARPGGRVVITVWAPSAFEDLTDALLEAVVAEGGEAGAAAVDRFRARMSARRVPDSAGALAHWLHTLGLVDTRGEEVPRHVDLDDDLAWRVVLGTSRNNLVAGLDDEARERVRARLLASLRERGIARVDLTTLIGVGHRPADADDGWNSAIGAAEPAVADADGESEGDADADADADASIEPDSDARAEADGESEAEPAADSTLTDAAPEEEGDTDTDTDTDADPSDRAKGRKGRNPR